LSGISFVAPCAGTAGCPGMGIVVFEFGAGAFLAGACLAGEPSSTVEPKPALRVAMMDSAIDVTMKRTAEIVVAFESSVAEPRGPKAVCDPIPPNAPARSAAFPLCSSTTIIKKIQMTICTNNSA